MNIEFKWTNGWARVYINGLLHLHFRMRDYMGMQSWMDMGEFYVIEIYLTSREIRLEYDSHTKWESMLKVLDQNLV